MPFLMPHAYILFSHLVHGLDAGCPISLVMLLNSADRVQDSRGRNEQGDGSGVSLTRDKFQLWRCAY